jgi:hypothetical protein
MDEHDKTQLKKKKARRMGMRRNQQHKTQSRQARGVVREGEGREQGAEKERGAERAKMPGKSCPLSTEKPLLCRQKRTQPRMQRALQHA